MKDVAILGASGYIGGELLRLLHGHPGVRVVQATSDRLAGKPIGSRNPTLRGLSDLKFSRHEEIGRCDVLFWAAKHGQGHRSVATWKDKADVVIDLSADFQIKDASVFRRYYGTEHRSPELLSHFIAGFPELNREQIKEADLISVPGCIANAAILALWPLAHAGCLGDVVFVDGKAGSSGSGNEAKASSHHPVRSGVVRVFKPSGHRHEAEIAQACGSDVHLTASSVEAARGVQVTAFAVLVEALSQQDARAIYRNAYRDEPFVRVLMRPPGPYNLPEMKLLQGTNYCDIGFQLIADGRRVVAFSALDNLVKGGSGNAIQCMNIRMGWDERLGLDFPGLFPA